MCLLDDLQETASRGYGMDLQFRPKTMADWPGPWRARSVTQAIGGQTHVVFASTAEEAVRLYLRARRGRMSDYAMETTGRVGPRDELGVF